MSLDTPMLVSNTEPQTERRRLDPTTSASMIDIVPQGDIRNPG